MKKKQENKAMLPLKGTWALNAKKKKKYWRKTMLVSVLFVYVN